MQKSFTVKAMIADQRRIIAKYNKQHFRQLYFTILHKYYEYKETQEWKKR